MFNLDHTAHDLMAVKWKKTVAFVCPQNSWKKGKKKEIKVAVKDFNYAYIARQNKLHKILQDKEMKNPKKPLFIHLSNLHLQIFTSSGTT